MRVIIDASEVNQLADDMRRHADEVTGRTELLVSDTGHAMHSAAIARAPRLTGHMDASDSLAIAGLGFDLGPTVDYGVFVELGTSKMAAEPFLGPSFDEGLPGFERALGDIGADVFSRG